MAKPSLSTDHDSYHIDYFGPNDVWPEGGWSVYHISGDEIASRIIMDADGNVTSRHSWPGFIGIWATLSEVAAVIEGDKRLRALRRKTP